MHGCKHRRGILNIILDYILVGVLGVGVQGSAIGSLMVQLVKDLILLGYFSGHKAGIILMKYVGRVAAFPDIPVRELLSEFEILR